MKEFYSREELELIALEFYDKAHKYQIVANKALIADEMEDFQACVYTAALNSFAGKAILEIIQAD